MPSQKCCGKNALNTGKSMHWMFSFPLFLLVEYFHYFIYFLLKMWLDMHSFTILPKLNLKIFYLSHIFIYHNLTHIILFITLILLSSISLPPTCFVLLYTFCCINFISHKTLKLSLCTINNNLHLATCSPLLVLFISSFISILPYGIVFLLPGEKVLLSV